MASTYIHRTPASSGSGTTFTISFWMKRGRLSFGNQTPFISHKGGSDYTWLRFNSSDQMEFLGYKGGPETFDLKTTRKFRDTSAWMHICITFDSTESTSTDRLKFYVNGVKETSFATSNYPTEDNTMIINDTTAANVIGVGYSSTGYVTADNHWDGCLSHFHFIDGTAYQASTFGETDSTSGIWKIKTGPSVTYGTNGFFLKMEDRTNLDLDSGTNAFTFTTVGTGTPTYDNPSNNFCTMNPLDNYYWGATFSNGNLSVVSGSNETFSQSTVSLSSGKWYWEYKDVTATGQDEFGFSSSVSEATNDKTNNGTSGRCGMVWNNYSTGQVTLMKTAGSTPYTAFNDFTSGDILGFYMDLDNNKGYAALNGVIQNSGTGLDLEPVATTNTGFYSPVWGEAASGNMTAQVNFGNGYFGTTAITSPTADEGGIGAFKYDPSDGGASSFDGSAKDFRAICTKNIKLYGG